MQYYRPLSHTSTESNVALQVIYSTKLVGVNLDLEIIVVYESDSIFLHVI